MKSKSHWRSITTNPLRNFFLPKGYPKWAQEVKKNDPQKGDLHPLQEGMEHIDKPGYIPWLYLSHLRLEAKELEGPLSWTVFDADAFTEIKGPGLMGDQRCQFTRSYASVSEKGEVSALRPGDVTVLAMDRMFNKEIFGIRIS